MTFKAATAAGEAELDEKSLTMNDDALLTEVLSCEEGDFHKWLLQKLDLAPSSVDCTMLGQPGQLARQNMRYSSGSADDNTDERTEHMIDSLYSNSTQSASLCHTQSIDSQQRQKLDELLDCIEEKAKKIRCVDHLIEKNLLAADQILDDIRTRKNALRAKLCLNGVKPSQLHRQSTPTARLPKEPNKQRIVDLNRNPNYVPVTAVRCPSAPVRRRGLPGDQHIATTPSRATNGPHQYQSVISCIPQALSAILPRKSYGKGANEPFPNKGRPQFSSIRRLSQHLYSPKSDQESSTDETDQESKDGHKAPLPLSAKSVKRRTIVQRSVIQPQVYNI